MGSIIRSGFRLGFRSRLRGRFRLGFRSRLRSGLLLVAYALRNCLPALPAKRFLPHRTDCAETDKEK